MDKEIYLNKIVEYLVDDTEIGNTWFNPPYYIGGSGRYEVGRTGFRSIFKHTFGLLDNTAYSGLDTQLTYFNHYCKDTYGLTGQECLIVWKLYMQKLYELKDWGFLK